MKYTLEQLGEMSSRKLDAIAHEAVFGDKPVEGDMFTVAIVDGRSQLLPDYSADLNATAQLEARLAERGLDENYAEIMFNAQFPRHTGDIYEYRLFPLIHASALDRTIAAVVAAQEAK